MPTRAIKAIFYTRFHHEKGSRVLHQVPPGSVTRSDSTSALQDPLFSFASISPYLIPTQQFCDRLLTFSVNHHRIIGYPVCIREGKYSRNEFIFNFAVVIGESEEDWACYGEVVRKLGRLLRGLEEQGGFLSKEEEGVWDVDDGKGMEGWEAGSKVYALCEMVLEDLNNYAECMIPIDDSNTINLKLFPTRPPPPPILAHQVPLLTISLSSLQSPVSSDLTLNRILPYVNGVHSIARIAQLADTDLSLTRRAIQHLVYYGCLVLLDIFSFSAIYAPTAEIWGFVVDDAVKDECIRYIRVPRLRIGSEAKTIRLGSDSETSHNDSTSTSSSSHPPLEPLTTTTPSTLRTSSFDTNPHNPPAPSTSNNDDNNSDENEWPIDHPTLIHLYTSLRQGLSLKSWVLSNLSALHGIDVRRLITFGIIKGFLYRVHKYAVATTSALPPAPPTSLATSTVNLGEVGEEHQKGLGGGGPTGAGGAGGIHGHHHPSFSLHRPSTTSLHQSHQHQLPQQEHDGNTAEHVGILPGERENALPLLRFLDGMHCFDEMCTELGFAEKVLEGKVRGMGEGLGVIIQR